MDSYKLLLKEIMTRGEDVTDRTGIGTRSIFGYQSRYDLQKGFPAITTKKLAWTAVVGELLWFLEGSTDERRLAELTFGKPRQDLIGKRTIWTANADTQGRALGYANDELYKNLGPVYGEQWREFSGSSHSSVDQIKTVIDEIKTNPDSRRLIVSAWNPLMNDIMALPPCHTFFQFRVYNGKLSCQMYQRSADVGLGVGFNVASYALLTHMIARECNLEVGTLIHTIGDAHIYLNHMDAMQEILKREPYPSPTLKIDPTFDLMERLNNGFRLSDRSLFTLQDYKCHPAIPMPMAV